MKYRQAQRRRTANGRAIHPVVLVGETKGHKNMKIAKRTQWFYGGKCARMRLWDK